MIAWRDGVLVNSPRHRPIITASLLVGALAGCGTKPADDPSYLLVVLDAVASPMGPPSSARVRVTPASGAAPSTLCVKLDAPGAAKPASFVLRRDFGKDPKPRVTIEVTAFAALQGDDAAEVGKEFGCPGVLPPSLGEPQVVTVDFCEHKAQELVFEVGASCGCDPDMDAGAGDGGMPDGGVDGGLDGGADAGAMDGGADAGPMDGGSDGGADAGPDGGACGCGPLQVCGAGLSTEGRPCGPSECCASAVTAACALEAAH